MNKKFKSRSPKETHKIAVEVFKKNKRRPWLILLRGAVGAGKTEWVKGFVHHVLGPKQVVTSPTYSLVNAYKRGKLEIYHADLYRLQSADDLESIGFWDLLEGPKIVIVEWGELLPPQWPRTLNMTHVDFNIKAGDEREILVSSLWIPES